MSGTQEGAGERLNRFLARRGVASRRRADGLIAAGRVSVNGVPAGVGARIDAGADAVAVDGEPVARAAPPATTLALHKPPGVVSTLADTHGRPTVAGLVPDIPGLVPIGRLDTDSRGLLLLTTDGDLAHRVAHPRHGVRKTYVVELREPLPADAEARLRDGVVLEDGPARVLELRPDASRRTRAEVVMGEGRKREVRRLFAAVGAEVVDLCRVAVGPVRLGELSEGTARLLAEDELAALHAASGGGRQTAPATS